MDGYAPKIDAWPRACLDNEPIYCPEPSPLNSDDIICRGSDDEADEASNIAKTLRYEKHGRRYLQGESLRILSASLLGPFNEASGWQNPWLPKVPSQHAQCLDSPPQPPAASSVARYESDIPVDRISSEEDGTIQNVDDSMECHLPSPQSHEDLQFSDSTSRFEGRSRIESWAENVHEGVLEKDEFWAPDHDSLDHDAESAGKRPAGRDWLKRRPAKRRRPDASQGTEATSTPTPLPTAQLRAKNSKSSVIGRRSARRSFEMTTPSSSPNRGPKESPNLAERQLVTSYEEDGQPLSSTMPTGDSRMSAEPHTRIRQEESQGKDDGEPRGEEEPEEDGALENMCQSQPQKQTSHSDEKPEETGNFQNYNDESFYYRARQPPASNANIPILPNHGDAVIVASSMDTTESNSNTMCDHSNSGDVDRAERPNEHFGSATFYIESDHPAISTLGADRSLLECHETMFRSCGITDTSADTVCASGVSMRGPLSDITSNERASRLNMGNKISQTVIEVKEAKITRSSEPFFDEDVTLIGDPVDMEEPGDIELFQQNPGHYPGYYSSEVSFLLQHYAISATAMASASQQSQFYDATIPNNMNDAASCNMATTPQQEAVELQLTTGKPTNRNSQEEVVNPVAGAEAAEGQNEDIPQIVADGQTVPPKQQSPWPPLRAVNESVQPSNDNIKRVEDELKELPAQPIVVLLDSPALMHFSPTIRPSQQSPWAGDVAEPINATRPEGGIGIETAVVTNIELPEIFQSPPLPEDQEHMWCASSLAILPTSSKSSQVSSAHESLESNIVRKEDSIATIQSFPYTPLPQIARQSTPDGEVSIRTFSNFNFFSPRRPFCPPSSSVHRSILSSRICSSTRTSTKSTRRVLFAPLPHEQEDDYSQLSTKLRAASPPPPTLVDLEEEHVDGKYRNHFDAMNRRLSIRGTPTLRYHQRLLPSSSQRKPESPAVEAMAEAFQEADARRLGHTDNVVQDTETYESESVEVAEERPQSPWQHDSQGTDDVAAVMGNLTQFLDVWDVDTEIDRNRAELDATGG
ncbi:hypothetical protein E0Z10_g1643 [Xylaria hypoxylon]|uniref:Protamine P1 n=1 Tax=Xylaria hypoxylon TaxID=37992 RepID=A0A4Z0Z845_9PEZI|nr:hypothetical protein E0Z10_g1643 [Xylaria hypoxylon]